MEGEMDTSLVWIKTKHIQGCREASPLEQNTWNVLRSSLYLFLQLLVNMCSSRNKNTFKSHTQRGNGSREKGDIYSSRRCLAAVPPAPDRLKLWSWLQHCGTHSFSGVCLASLQVSPRMLAVLRKIQELTDGVIEKKNHKPKYLARIDYHNQNQNCVLVKLGVYFAWHMNVYLGIVGFDHSR